MAILYGTMQDGSLVRVQADSQGRLVAELANPVDPSNYVPITGAVMTGNLTVPSLNHGQLAGFRNVLINGQVSLNQRNVTYSAAAVGDYWADRWKKTASGMTQIVEAGSFAPSTEYTLSGNGVSTQQVTSPASGDWTIPDVPSTATNIQLEPGSVATPFEHRPVGIELSLCERYFQTENVQGGRGGGFFHDETTLNGPMLRGRWHFCQEMRAVPTVTLTPLFGDGIYENWTPIVNDNYNNVVTTKSAPIRAGLFTFEGKGGNGGRFELQMVAEAEL
jgi:hypothetical protein